MGTQKDPRNHFFEDFASYPFGPAPYPFGPALYPFGPAKKEPTASKMTPKWSPNGTLVGIKKTLRRHLDKKVPTSMKPHYLLCFVKIHTSQTNTHTYLEANKHTTHKPKTITATQL